MSLQQTIEKIERLKQEIATLLPLTKDQEQALWKKYRLEWNYNSNHIEGNTLTYQETELLIIFGKAVGNHDMREFEEMKAHDAAIQLVREWAADTNRPISEVEIRQLNKILLVEPFYKQARTPSGAATRRVITPGVYKEYPNHVVLANGEVFKYAEPNEVATKMEELMAWYNNGEATHPIVKAAVFHYKLVCIHPFDDGNGRVCRLLLNYHLLRHGYAPIIIKTADKKNYLTALNRADTGDLNAFVEYIVDQLPWSMELYLKALKGETLEEPDDLDKELALIEKQLNSKKSIPLLRNKKNIEIVITSVIYPFFDKIVSELSRFESLFERVKKRIGLNNVSRRDLSYDRQKEITLILIKKGNTNNLGLEYTFEDLKNIAESITYRLTIDVEFNRSEFIIYKSLNSKRITLQSLKYDQLLSEAEQKKWIKEIKEYLLVSLRDTIKS